MYYKSVALPWGFTLSHTHTHTHTHTQICHLFENCDPESFNLGFRDEGCIFPMTKSLEE